MTTENLKLVAKIKINGFIVAQTGLHIGGSKTALDIGGIDLNVIKTVEGVPFVPGSSLKGKLRTMLAREAGSMKVSEDRGAILEIFGGGERNAPQAGRLIVRDAFLDSTHFKKTFDEMELELPWTESKWENTINRKTGTAEHPRQLERVPAGTRFAFEIIYNNMNDNRADQHLNEIRKAMRLLQDDYLGGQGSRGYGEITFEKMPKTTRKIDDYRAGLNGTTEPFSLV